jgi:hypothetical protein
MICVVDAACRSAFSGAYSSEECHARAASASGNSITTQRSHGHGPSSTSTAPPRAMKRPPWLATASVLPRR